MLNKLVKNIVLASKNGFETESLLVGGLGRVTAVEKNRQERYILRKQNKDGGFSGRLGYSDMYYTAFAAKAMLMLNAGNAGFWKKLASFAGSYKVSEMGLSGLASFLQVLDILEKKKQISAAKEIRNETLELLGQYEDRTGGYLKSPMDTKMSLYNSFLAMLCLSKLKVNYPNREKTAVKIIKRQRRDGGFSDMGYDSYGQSNPSAAAVMTLYVFDRLSNVAKSKAVKYFSGMQVSSGGFLAHKKAPVPDLLSTYTVLLTLKALGCLGKADEEQALKFVRSLMLAGGGFKSVQIDNNSDLEYTYYGLGCLGLLEK